MNDFTQRVAVAKTDTEELNKLISDYMPFIRREVSKTPVFSMDYDDRLSLAMLVFMNCVRNYETTRGAFLPFAAICIRNRLMDEGKKQQRHHDKVIPLFTEDEDSKEIVAALNAYSITQEQLSLAEEIDRLRDVLLSFGIALNHLSQICPKQKRSRGLCARLARAAVADDEIKHSLLAHQRLSGATLARQFDISEKTVEKHRKYIVTIALILSGDYPGIQEFLPNAEEVQ